MSSAQGRQYPVGPWQTPAAYSESSPFPLITIVEFWLPIITMMLINDPSATPSEGVVAADKVMKRISNMISIVII
jgi:hypothetical protein